MDFNKKGQANMVPTEVIRGILGIAVVLVLIGLLVALFGMFSANAKLDQAKSSLTSLVTALESSTLSSDETSFKIESPRDWLLIYFQSNKNLCLCPYAEKDLNQVCISKGTCQNLKFPLEFNGENHVPGFSTIKISPTPKTIVLSKTGDTRTINSDYYIWLKKAVDGMSEGLKNGLVILKCDENSQKNIQEYFSKKLVEGEYELVDYSKSIESSDEEKLILFSLENYDDSGKVISGCYISSSASRTGTVYGNPVDSLKNYQVMLFTPLSFYKTDTLIVDKPYTIRAYFGSRGSSQSVALEK